MAREIQTPKSGRAKGRTELRRVVMYGKEMAREAAFFVCALVCGAEKWYNNYLRNVREVILYEIRCRGRFT